MSDCESRTRGSKVNRATSGLPESDNQPFKIILVGTGRSLARTGSRPNQVNIVVIDNSVRFNIVPKIRSRHWQAQLRFDLVDVSRVYDAIRRDISDENTHCCLNIAGVYPVIHAGQCHDDGLRVIYSGEIYQNLIASNAVVLDPSRARCDACTLY